MTKYNYHFTMRNATTGEIYEHAQDDVAYAIKHIN